MQRINLKKNLIKVLLVLLTALLVVNCILTFLNGDTIVENNALRQQTDQIKQSTERIIADIVHGADLAVRGYGLTKNDKLSEPLRISSIYKDSVFLGLERQFVAQRYDTSSLYEMKAAVEDYLLFSNEMIEMARQDSMKRFISILNEDRGFDLWKKYMAFREPLFSYEDTLNKEAEDRYLAAVGDNRLIVLVLLIVGVPTMIYIITRLGRDEKQLAALLHNLDQQNRQYIFDSGSPLDANDIDHVIEHSIQNFRKANTFISSISAGSYAVEWESLDDTNHSLNQSNLAGNLIKMRDHLNHSKLVNEKREWSVSGLAKLLTLIQNQRDIKELGNSVVKYIVKYTRSNQACLFAVPVEQNMDDEYLSLVSCYAWSRNRYINMTITKREGLVGQCWYEREPILLTHVPEDYVQISSGLGDALPRCVYIAPIKMNNVVYGVLELASFNRFEEFELEFINKACESIAACIFAVRMTEKSDLLLSQYTSQIESLKSQLHAASVLA
ncbi:GAF domain-containing protein [Ohtaekwangia koreensis]|uniref:GAF domain-containing protein n=1 Tax=Ohtaekwangia koreensis TaxID=688867 RepID=A0A1T5KL72_9BACT|nr:GAF domain-containing protein [Ohtaekwangia koreensis]SKC64502.1 GAF domain-containing protein [Ohtaekwangia koreensis]